MTINKRYEEVRSNIEQSINHFKSGDSEAAYYYMNELVVSKNDRQWRAVGNYKKNSTFLVHR